MCAVVKARMQRLQDDAARQSGTGPWLLAVAVFHLTRTVMHTIAKLVVAEITNSPQAYGIRCSRCGCGCERTASSKLLIVDGKQVAESLYETYWSEGSAT
jgi:hypothetical protein